MKDDEDGDSLELARIFVLVQQTMLYVAGCACIGTVLALALCAAIAHGAVNAGMVLLAAIAGGGTVWLMWRSSME